MTFNYERVKVECEDDMWWEIRDGKKSIGVIYFENGKYQTDYGPDSHWPKQHEVEQYDTLDDAHAAIEHADESACRTCAHYWIEKVGAKHIERGHCRRDNDHPAIGCEEHEPDSRFCG